ncbi:hypothetical protein QYE76_071027 [Lolium multiflorum]|uniref:Aminotransferase-like plant mobile domain-containing protein n=1 Tax=Lolium multiflorum TaxID=4521 RepID=A0AAD8WGF4_LOLMU|nr:hypothetical protein QYE76_071027 [Lolium multiflorum]
MVMYRQYTAELDTLTVEQVEWEPYGSYYHIGSGMADLNHKCMEEARFWRMRCPLICMWLVEHHQPQRVMRQFGLYQECPPQWQDTDKALHRLDRQRQRKITNWPVHHSGHVAAFLHCLEATRNAGPEQIVPHDFAAFNNYLEWFHENTRIEIVKHAYPEDILDDPIQFDEVGQSQHDTFARRGRSTSIASELNFVREEIQKTAEECEVMWEQSRRDDKPVGPLRYFIKNTARKMRRLASLLGCREGEIATSPSSEEREILEDELIQSQGILPKHTSKQAPRSAYQFKPRGKGPNRYTPEDYVNRGKKVVTEEDEGPPRRSALSRMRNDEPFSSEEEEQEQQEQQQQEPRQRTKRMAVRKQPGLVLGSLPPRATPGRPNPSPIHPPPPPFPHRRHRWEPLGKARAVPAAAPSLPGALPLQAGLAGRRRCSSVVCVPAAARLLGGAVLGGLVAAARRQGCWRWCSPIPDLGLGGLGSGSLWCLRRATERLVLRGL